MGGVTSSKNSKPVNHITDLRIPTVCSIDSVQNARTMFTNTHSRIDHKFCYRIITIHSL